MGDLPAGALDVPLAPPPPPTALSEPLSMARIQHYVWRRYVDYQPAPYPLDEDAALAFLEEHYRHHALKSDAECFYYGILAYERSFVADHSALICLERALLAFRAWRAQAGVDFRWDAVDDRMDDVLSLLEQQRGGKA